MTDDILARHQALCDADDDPTYDAVRNSTDSYYEAIAEPRKERMVEQALEIAREHVAWAAKQPGGMKLIAYGIGRPDLGEPTYHHHKRRAILAAAVAAEWIGMPKA